MDNTFKNLPNEIHKEIIDKDGTKLICNISDIDRMKEEYIDLSVHEYSKEKEKYTKEKRKFDIKYHFIFGSIIISILLMLISIFIEKWWFFILGMLLFTISTVIGFNTFNPKKDYAEIFSFSSDYKKYYDANMYEADIFKIFKLETIFNILNKINNLDEKQPIKIKADASEINILFVDKNNCPYTITLDNMTYFIATETNQVCYFEYKNIENIEVTNHINSIIVTLPLKYSSKYKDLIE